MCDHPTDHYWSNFENAAHMLCDACFIQLSQATDAYRNSNEYDEGMSNFSDMFDEWRNGGLDYQKVTPQSMMERFFINILTKEIE